MICSRLQAVVAKTGVVFCFHVRNLRNISVVVRVGECWVECGEREQWGRLLETGKGNSDELVYSGGRARVR